MPRVGALKLTNSSTAIVGGVDMRVLCSGFILASCAFAASQASASETVTYTYDAKGRLVKVERAGAVNNGVKYEYTHDKANNRRNLKVTGSTNPPPP